MSDEARVHIRWAIRRDFPEILAIEAASFDDPWIEAEFLTHLRHDKTIGKVAEINDRIVGFVFYELKPRSLSVLNLAVHPGHRRRGVGSQMVANLRERLSPLRRTSIDLICRETNDDAHLFWRATGFRATEVIRGWFEHEDGRTEDGYRFEYRLAVPAGEAAHV